MTEDLLERATKALREQGGAEPPSDRAAFMRARVLSQAKRSSKLRPQGIWQWAAVVGLGFFVSTAMAQVIAVQLPRVIEALRAERAEEAKPKKAKPSRAAKPVQPKAAPVLQEPNVVEDPPAQPVPDAAPAAPSIVEDSPARAAQDAASAAPSVRGEPPAQDVPTPTRAPRSTKPVVPKRSLSTHIPVQPSEPPLSAAAPEPEPEPAVKAPAKPAPAPEPDAAAAESAELALFRRAQALHVAHDPRAIAAWDAFLRVAGSSVLAPEARYNRALGLVRANRFDEARRALKPFAAGAYGVYRKQEAAALLARMPE